MTNASETGANSATNVNIARIAGIVTGEPEFDHSLFGESFFSARVMVQRMSGAVDVLPVTLPERVFAKAGARMPGDGRGIDITGQLRSYNKTYANGTKLVLSVFARETTLSDALIEPVNSIELAGYLCKAAVFRTTPFKREIADMLIAVNRAYDKSDYLPCIAWGRNARFVSGVEVGSKLKIKGRLQSREYQKLMPDGSTAVRVAYEVSCASLELV